jgi:2-dehydropantoate 2-reductase
MFGRGVIASVYGWVLEQAGNDVEFYVRPGRAAQYGPVLDLDLLDLRRSIRGSRVIEHWPVRLREEFDASDGFDVVIVSVAHDRLATAIEFLAPRVGNTTVLVLGNAMGDLSAAVTPVPIDQVVWGFPGAGGGFQPDGRLQSVLQRTVTFAAPSERNDARHLAMRRMFSDAGLRLRQQPDLPGWLAVHLVLDAGMFAQGLRLGTLSELVGRRDALTEAFLTSRELLPVLAAQGIDLRRHRSAVALLRHPHAAGALLAWATRHVAAARISLEAHTDPAAAEPRAVVRDVLAMAHDAGMSAPRLAAAVRAS